jgi:uncharacterized protein (DUF58 family)
MAVLATLKQKLFRWESDGVAPLRLGQRRVFILPTRGGLVFAIALIAMLLGAINYTLALGHALVFLLVGLGLNGMVHTFRNLYGLIITPGRCEPVFVGETAHFGLTIENDRPTPRLALEFEAEPDNVVNATVHGLKSEKINIPLSTHQRGWLALPRIKLASRYPLGFFVAWSYLNPTLRCLVYPEPIFIPLPPPSAVEKHGESRGDGGQDDFAGFRDRHPADSLRHVAWKLSARDTNDRPLQVKQFAGGAQQERQLDWLLSDSSLPVETRISHLTGWVLQADAEGETYGLILPDTQIAPGHGTRHREQCLEALAVFAP